MDVRCQCGSIEFKTPSDKPKAVYHCHCTQCRKQSASAFGTSAVFTSEGMFPMEEELAEKMTIYTRDGQENGGIVECYFCKICGCRVLHRKQNESGYAGGVVMIKGGLIDDLKWEGGVHIFTETAVVPIPEGAEKFQGAPPQS